MSDERGVMAAQIEALRMATDAGHGGTARKVLASALGVSESALRNYMDGTNVMGLAVFSRLVAFRPDLASLLLPDGFAAVRQPDGMDHAQFARCCGRYSGAYVEARDPASEAGEAIGPGEDTALGRLRVAAVGPGGQG